MIKLAQQEQLQNDRLADLEHDAKKLDQTVTELEDIQHVQIEITDRRRYKVDDKLESLNHKLHTLSNLYMAMEEKINELAEFGTLLKSELDDLRQSIKSISNRSNADSDTTTQGSA